MNIKVKLWIEDKNNNLIFGDGKNLVMDYIDQTNCISQTAKTLNMTQEQVLKHLQIVEDNNAEEMVLRIQGLKTTSKPSYILTPEAREILQTYQIFQHDVRRFAKQKLKEFQEKIK